MEGSRRKRHLILPAFARLRRSLFVAIALPVFTAVILRGEINPGPKSSQPQLSTEELEAQMNAVLTAQDALLATPNEPIYHGRPLGFWINDLELASSGALTPLKPEAGDGGTANSA